LCADVGVDKAGVVVDVDFAVVIEVAIGPTRQARRNSVIDADVVIDVDLAIQICVAAVGVHHEDVAPGDGLSGPRCRGGGGGGDGVGGFGDADGGVVSAGGV